MWGDLNTGEAEGGFMDESYSTSTQSTQKDGKKKENKAILPIMIGHLLRETPHTLQNYGSIAVSTLRIVAVVRKITEATTKLAYELEDETGAITAYRWLETDSAVANVTNDIKLNSYVVVHGCLRESGEESRHLFILSIRSPEKYAEIFSHLLEVAMAARNKSNELRSPVKNGQQSNTAQPTAYDDNATGLSPEQAIIFKLIKEVDEHDIGIERDDIKSKVPTALASKVDDILDFLVSEGHIYTTRTDDHFKAT